MFTDQPNCSENEILSLIRESDCSSKVGFEREGLRVGNSLLSKKPHPESLGSALCNKFITTDFSEAQLELVTPPHEDKKDAMQFLDNIHHFTSHKIEDEIIWPFSMPLDIGSDEDIHIAFAEPNLQKRHDHHCYSCHPLPHAKDCRRYHRRRPRDTACEKTLDQGI